MKKLILFFCFVSQSLSAQVSTFQSEFDQINENLMVGLGSYALSNFAMSGAGYVLSDDETTQRFHEMNVMWNSVNFGLALPGYLKAKKGSKELTLEEMIQKQKKTETIFLVNDILDVGYIALGFWMRNESKNRPDRSEMFKGYGNSLILQGSFLLVFDAYAYFLHRNHGKGLTEMDRVSLNLRVNGIGLLFDLD